jgi:hypothetical protein
MQLLPNRILARATAQPQPGNRSAPGPGAGPRACGQCTQGERQLESGAGTSIPRAGPICVDRRISVCATFDLVGAVHAAGTGDSAAAARAAGAARSRPASAARCTIDVRASICGAPKARGTARREQHPHANGTKGQWKASTYSNLPAVRLPHTFSLQQNLHPEGPKRNGSVSPHGSSVRQVPVPWLANRNSELRGADLEIDQPIHGRAILGRVLRNVRRHGVGRCTVLGGWTIGVLVTNHA